MNSNFSRRSILGQGASVLTLLSTKDVASGSFDDDNTQKNVKKCIKKDGSTDVCTKYYNTEGKLHRDDGPARISVNNDRQEYFEEWFLNGKKHRSIGPATTGICFMDNKENRWEEYWIDNRLISSGTQISGQTMWPDKIEHKEMETVK